jgi:hypothetical protein
MVQVDLDEIRLLLKLKKLELLNKWRLVKIKQNERVLQLVE